MLRRSRAERLLLSQPPAWHLLRGWGTSAKRTVRVGPGPYDVAAGFGKGYGLACVQADHRPTMFRVGLPQGVKPVIGTGDGSIWVGGKALTRVDLASQTTRTLYRPEAGQVASLATDGHAVWAAI